MYTLCILNDDFLDSVQCPEINDIHILRLTFWLHHNYLEVAYKPPKFWHCICTAIYGSHGSDANMPYTEHWIALICPLTGQQGESVYALGSIYSQIIYYNRSVYCKH